MRNYFKFLDFGIVCSLALVCQFFSLSCATKFPAHPTLNLVDENEYYKAVKTFSDRKQIYDGFYNTLDLSMTFLNTPVSRMQLDENARIYQWSEDIYNNEKSKNEDRLAKQTDFFLSLYTPESKNNDLNKTKTLWKVFLDAGGRRYEAKVIKIKTLPTETLALYPNFNRFSTPYKVTFPVAISLVENQESKVTITGPVGSAQLVFKNADSLNPNVK